MSGLVDISCICIFNITLYDICTFRLSFPFCCFVKAFSSCFSWFRASKVLFSLFRHSVCLIHLIFVYIFGIYISIRFEEFTKHAYVTVLERAKVRERLTSFETLSSHPQRLQQEMDHLSPEVSIIHSIFSSLTLLQDFIYLIYMCM